jgi:hypothetical protein
VITQSIARSQQHPIAVALHDVPSQAERTSSEDKRIEFLVQRDGRDVATAWVERTLGIYRVALLDPRSYALLPQYRPLFEGSIETFEFWLKAHDQPDNK